MTAPRAWLVVVAGLQLMLAVGGCTVGSRGPDPVTARPPPDPDRMPTEVLEHQDPGADTSKNRVLSRTEAHYRDPSSPTEQLLGCLRMFACSTSGHGSDASGALVVAAVLAATRRRRRVRR